MRGNGSTLSVRNKESRGSILADGTAGRMEALLTSIQSPVYPEQASDDILTIKQAAKFFHVPLSTMYEMAQHGRIPAQKVGRSWKFSKEALNQHMGRQSAPMQRLHPDDIDAVASAVMTRLRAAFISQDNLSQKKH